MPQVSLYVDDATMESLRTEAAREGTSLSKHVSTRIKKAQARQLGRCNTPSGMPEGFFERLYGCIDDDSFVRPKQPEFALDFSRLSFE